MQLPADKRFQIDGAVGGLVEQRTGGDAEHGGDARKQFNIRRPAMLPAGDSLHGNADGGSKLLLRHARLLAKLGDRLTNGKLLHILFLL